MKPQRSQRSSHRGRRDTNFFSLCIASVSAVFNLLLFGIPFFGLTSFQPADKQPELGQMEKGRKLYEAGEYRAAYEQFRKATAIFQQKDEGPGLIESIAGQANVLMTLSLEGQNKGDSVDVLMDSLDLVVGKYQLAGDSSMSTVFAARCIYHLISGAANSLELGCGYCDQAYQWADSLRGESYALLPEYLGNIAYCNQLMGSFEAAYENYREQRRLIRNYHPENVASLAYSYANTAPIFHFWGQLDSALWYSQEAIGILEQQLPDHPDLLTYYINYAALLGEVGKLKSSRDYLIMAQNIIENQQGEPSPSIALSHILNNLAVYYQDVGMSDSAVWYIERALDMERQLYGPDHPEIALTLANTGSIFAQRGSPDLGLLYLYQALAQLEDKQQDNEADLRNIYREMGLAYSLNHNYDSAFAYFDREIALLEKAVTVNEVELGKAYSNLGRASFTQKQYKKAATYLKKAISLQKKALQNEFHPQLAITLEYLGLTYGRLRKWPQGERMLRRSLEIRQHNHHQVALAWRALGTFFTYTQKYSLALQYYEHALANATELNSDEQVLLLTEAADIFYQKAHKSLNKKPLLHQAEKLFLQASNLTDSLLMGLVSDSSRLLLLKNVFPLYESLIHTQLQLSEQTDSARYIESAFAISEKTKAVSLLQAFRSRELQHWKDVPDSLIDRGREMRTRIKWLQAFLKVDDFAMKEHQELAQRLRDYEIYLKKLRLEHPQYFHLTYAPPHPDFTQIRQQLKNDSLCLIEYFWGDKSVYVFVANADTFFYRTIQKDSAISRHTERFTALCSQVQPQMEAFQAHAQQLYQSLLADIMPTIRAFDKLLIIPDGPLSQLPFELLLTESQTASTWYGLPYLFKDKQIQYAPSAQVWLQMSRQAQKVQHNGKLIAFAPTFEETSMISGSDRSHIALKPLNWNEEEISRIPDGIQKDLYVGMSANESAFKKEVGKYMIVHLATHGILNPPQALKSFLAFSPESLADEDQRLHMYELLSQQLNAELVVLSACETGSGKWEKGEGLLSMGRAFAYAGASSLLVSLWQVDDASTADFMALFYENLLIGMEKSAALQQARIQFLDRFPLKSAPYYWAGFVLNGEGGSMRFERSFSWWWLIGGLLFIGLLIWGIRRIG